MRAKGRFALFFQMEAITVKGEVDDVGEREVYRIKVFK